jgi:hypothetical protein
VNINLFKVMFFTYRHPNLSCNNVISKTASSFIIFRNWNSNFFWTLLHSPWFDLLTARFLKWKFNRISIDKSFIAQLISIICFNPNIKMSVREKGRNIISRACYGIIVVAFLFLHFSGNRYISYIYSEVPRSNIMCDFKKNR